MEPIINRIFALLFGLVVFSGPSISHASEVLSPQQEWIIKVANEHIKKTSPKIDLTNQKPTIEYIENSVAHKGPIWVVGYSFSPKDPVTGQVIGVRPVSLDVWVRPNGTVEGSLSHSP